MGKYNPTAKQLAFVERSQDKILNWLHLREKLQEVKTLEMDLRKEIARGLFAGQESKQSVEIPANDYRPALKVNNITRRQIDESALSEMYDFLDEETKACINFKPQVKWASLPEDSQIWDIIIEKPAAPTIEVKR
jgi:hypothetical protein